MSMGQRPKPTRSVWSSLLMHLGKFGRTSPVEWNVKGRHWRGRSGGGDTSMRIAKFLSRRVLEREHHPTQAERNQRRNKRQRIARRVAA
jgi:hypothetical protein